MLYVSTNNLESNTNILCVLSLLLRNMHILLGNVPHPPTLFCVTIYTLIYHYSCVLCYCYIYTHMLPVLSYFLYSHFRLLPIMYIFQLIVPATNTHITYVHGIYVLLMPTFGTSNSL